MRGSVYPRCFCRDPKTRKPLGRKCPRLRSKGHAAGWFFRYDAPRSPDGERRRPEVGPFATQKAAEEELAATLARLGGGAQVPDRSLLTGSYLDSHIAGKINLKPRTRPRTGKSSNSTGSLRSATCAWSTSATIMSPRRSGR